MTDECFYDNIDMLASQLKHVSYFDTFTEDKLKKDWNNLCKYKAESNNIASTSRIGMKLCQHFFPNFYDLETPKSRSFSELWQDESLLKKVLIWNRKSHSTPYLSELKRGIYFCAGITKSTMYRPQMAKIITANKRTVFDPCAGWGGRMLGSVANGCKYYAFEANTETYENLNKLIHFLNIGDHIEIFNDDVLNQETTQSIYGVKSYSEWVDKFLEPTIMKSLSRLKNTGESCWNVAKVNKDDMWSDVYRVHKDLDFAYSGEYNVVSSKRPTSDTSKKNFDRTVKFIGKQYV